MKLLAIVGTAAMFLVGGGILEHGVPPLHHAIEAIAAGAGAVAGIGGVLKVLVTMLLDGLIGIVAGAIVLGGVLAYRRVFGRKACARLRPRRAATAPGYGYFSDSIRSTYSCIASSLDLPLRPFQASHLARPTMSPKPGRLPSASPLDACL